MDTKEYLAKLPDVEKDARPEFHSFITVWVKSRQPDIYNELLSDFKYHESEIYAEHECNSHDKGVPF